MCAWICKVKADAKSGDLALVGAILYCFAVVIAIKRAVKDDKKNYVCCSFVLLLFGFVCGLILPFISCILFIVGGVRTEVVEAKALALTAAACQLVTLPVICCLWATG